MQNWVNRVALALAVIPAVASAPLHSGVPAPLQLLPYASHAGFKLYPSAQSSARSGIFSTITPAAPKASGVLQAKTASPATWSQPESYTDVEKAFAINHFAWGKDLLQLVASTEYNGTSNNARKGDGATLLSVTYPKGSIDPKAKTQGGVGFYATPLDISRAQNVTLFYDVYFPADFQWAKGGKLPGLYGGRDGCSGGDDAEDCFSTRLMFRENGQGELYLYAPVDQQKPSVCAMLPSSVCNPDYGASLGRGSFSFKSGSWTTIRQDVWLNAPGKSDGGFNLYANGKLVLHSDEIFYRKSNTTSTTNAQELIVESPANIKSNSFRAVDALDDQFDPLSDGFTGMPAKQRKPLKAQVLKAQLGNENTSVNFVGIMMETFFGGHTASYASPVNQSAYFKGFRLIINS